MIRSLRKSLLALAVLFAAGPAFAQGTQPGLLQPGQVVANCGTSAAPGRVENWMCAGSGAPTALSLFQDYVNTAGGATSNVRSVWDGTNAVPYMVIDRTNHNALFQTTQTAPASGSGNAYLNSIAINDTGSEPALNFTTGWLIDQNFGLGAANRQSFQAAINNSLGPTPGVVAANKQYSAVVGSAYAYYNDGGQDTSTTAMGLFQGLTAQSLGLPNTQALSASGVTVTIASPAVFTWPSTIPFSTAVPVWFYTNGALPTGLAVGTQYWVVPTTISGNTFEVSDTLAHAVAASNIVGTSASQSGTHTAVATKAATVTISIASPGVVTWTGHGFTGLLPIQFSSSGALPTGLTAGTTYYIVPSSITTNTFKVATTVANAQAGTAINTSGAQSGTQVAWIPPTGTNLWVMAAAEFDSGVTVGGSVQHRVGVDVGDYPFSSVHGTTTDAGIAVTGTSGVGFNTGILFSDFTGKAGVSPTGTLIGTATPTTGTPYTVGTGIDFTNYRFSAEAFHTSNVVIDASGTAIQGHVGTNKNISLTTMVNLASGTAVRSLDDAGTAVQPLELQASYAYLQGINIGAVSQDGFVLNNPTAATNGTQQYSPRVRYSGNVYDSGALASKPFDFIVEANGYQSSGGFAYLTIQSQINGGGYTNSFNFGSNGIFGATTAMGSPVLVGGFDNTKNLILGSNSCASATGLGCAAPNVVQSGSPGSGDTVSIATGAGTRVKILSNGNVGLGTETSPTATFVASSNANTGLTAVNSFLMGLIGTDGSNANVAFVAATNTTGNATAAEGVFNFFTSNGTAAVPTVMGTGSLIGRIAFAPYNGTAFNSAVRIEGVTGSTFNGTADRSAVIRYSTVPPGSTTIGQVAQLGQGLVLGTSTTDPGAGNMAAAGFISAVGNIASTGGSLQGISVGGNSLFVAGTAPTTGGTCAGGTYTFTGGNTGGTVQVTNAAGCGIGSTLVLTFSNTVSNGYTCRATNRTASARNSIRQTASTTTTATLTFDVAVIQNDVLDYACIGY